MMRGPEWLVRERLFVGWTTGGGTDSLATARMCDRLDGDLVSSVLEESLTMAHVMAPTDQRDSNNMDQKPKNIL
jgi:hypothetical protein